MSNLLLKYVCVVRCKILMCSRSDSTLHFSDFKQRTIFMFIHNWLVEKDILADCRTGNTLENIFYSYLIVVLTRCRVTSLETVKLQQVCRIYLLESKLSFSLLSCVINIEPLSKWTFFFLKVWRQAHKQPDSLVWFKYSLNERAALKLSSILLTPGSQFRHRI